MTEARTVLRIASQWLIGIALVVVLTAFLLALVGYQMTSAGTGQRILRRAIAETTDIDESIPRIETDLNAAAAGGEGTQVRVPNFPIPVDIPREEIPLGQPHLRQRLLDEGARRLYEDGTSQWAATDPQASQQIDRVSAAGAVHTGLGLIQDSTHGTFLVATVLLGLLALVLAAVLIATVPWHLRLLTVGVVVLAVGLPLLAGAVGLRFAFRTAEPAADPFVDSLLDLGVDAMWVPIRNYLTLTVLGGAITLMGLGVVWWQQREWSRAPAPPPGN